MLLPTTKCSTQVVINVKFSNFPTNLICESEDAKKESPLHQKTIKSNNNQLKMMIYKNNLKSNNNQLKIS